MWSYVFISALAISSVVGIPTKNVDNAQEPSDVKLTIDDTKSVISSINENLKTKVNDGETVKVIELSPELESDNITSADLMNGVLEFVEITPNGETHVSDVTIRELLNEQEEADEQDEVSDPEEVDADEEVTEDEDVDVEDDIDDSEMFVTTENYPEMETTDSYASYEDHDSDKLENTREILVTKDNIMPLLKTMVLATTHKESPTYKDVLKAGAISAFKSSMDYMGKEKLSDNILRLVKEYTTLLADDNFSEDEEEMAKLAEEYLKDNKFKIVVPESIFLQNSEMKQYLGKQSLTESGRQLDPGVTTLFTAGPLAWLAVLGTVIGIPAYFLSSDETERSDKPGRVRIQPPDINLQAPLPAGVEWRHPQHIRGGPPKPKHKFIPKARHPAAPTPAPGDLSDPRYRQYLKEYDEWYSKWYAHYLSTQNVENQENPEQVPHQQIPQQQNPQQQFPHQQVPRQQIPQQQFPQQQIPQHQNPHQQIPQHQIPRQQFPQQQHPQIEERQPIINDNIAAPANRPEAFGTFIPEQQREGNTHFQVTQVDVNGNVIQQEKPEKRPLAPSPRPVYQPTERPEANTQVLTAPPQVNVQNIAASNTQFSKPKPASVIAKKKPTKPIKFVSEKQPVVIQRQPITSSNVPPSSLVRQPPLTAQIVQSVPVQHFGNSNEQKFGDVETPSGFKPITPKHAPTVSATQIPTAAPHISGVTSGVFKTSARPTDPAATTPTSAAVFVQKPTENPATPLAVRVVTSTSVKTSASHVASQEDNNELPDLRRPQRNHEDYAPEENLVEVHEAVPFVSNGHQNPSTGYVKTNIPTKIRVVDNTLQKTRLSANAVPEETEETEESDLPIYALDPFYGPRLSRVDAIFHQLNQDEEGCREQVVCNMYKNPEVYTPLSDFLSRQLTVKMVDLQRPKVSDQRILRFFKYLKAAKLGQDGNDCKVKYPDCSTDTTRLSHKPMLHTYTKISKLMEESQG